MKVFNILLDLCQEQVLYIEPFLELLNNCTKRFLLDKSTDTEIYSSVLAIFYSDFGRKENFLFFFYLKKIFLFKDIFFV